MQKVSPNKNYGQHFLKDTTVINKTIELLRQYNTSDQIIEIGPGMGVLTAVLMEEFYDQLTCIEVDERCILYLLQNYPSLQGKIIHQDFLKLNLSEFIQQQTTIVGNFPYNISSQIIFKVLEHREQIPLLIGMFQKEVAERIAAPHSNKEYGILSVLTQLYYDAETVLEIPPSAFYPQPKVMSSILVLRKKKEIPTVNYTLLRRIVKAGFQQRRKMLRNALSQVVPKEILSEEFFQKRAEQLSVEDFVNLTNRIENIS